MILPPAYHVYTNIGESTVDTVASVGCTTDTRAPLLDLVQLVLVVLLLLLLVQ